jgi:glycosyltransferase involved in cell wall biosynthesis
MIHERFRHLFPPSDATISLKKTAILRADYIICISNSTRRDLLEYYDLPESKVRVIPLGFTATVDRQMAIPAVLLRRPFLLYVGNRNGYKNFDGLLRAYSSSLSLRQAFSLVCLGGGSFGPCELKLLTELGLTEEQVMQLGGSDDLLHSLYKQAVMFVCPSLYEGFGITLLEAMNAGCPIACSSTSSLPEVAGESALFFDPYDVESIRHALEVLADSDISRTELSIRGRERVKLFSWDKCAQETMAAYAHVLGT